MTAKCAILRTAKLKTMGNIAASLGHTYRTRDTPNADDRLVHRNEHSHGSPAQVQAQLEARLPDKRRKDAVLAIEYFIGASPAWFEAGNDGTAYLKDAVTWLEKRHGKENVVAWSIHRDETTPHLVAYVVPLDQTGKLNAKKWLGGRAALSAMQTDFAGDVGAKHGLQRGIEGSKAKHQSIKDWYAQVDVPADQVTISPQSVEPKVLKKQIFSTIVESPEMVADRLTKQIQATYAPAVQGAKTAASERRRADEMARTARSKDQALKTAQKRLQAITTALQPFIELAEMAKGAFNDLHQLATAKVDELRRERKQVRTRGISR